MRTGAARSAVALIVFLAAAAVLACGDKFVVLGRGIRFESVHVSAHPGSILIYMNPSSPLYEADKQLQLQSTLQMAGHKTAVAQDPAELGRVLGSGQYDLVLADISDMDRLEAKTSTVASRPAVVPVLYNPTSAQLAQAQRDHSCLVKATKKNSDLLTIVDEAIQSKAKGTEPQCPKK